MLEASRRLIEGVWGGGCSRRKKNDVYVFCSISDLRAHTEKESIKAIICILDMLLLLLLLLELNEVHVVSVVHLAPAARVKR